VDGKKKPTASQRVTGFQSTPKIGKHKLQSSAKNEKATVIRKVQAKRQSAEVI